MLASIIFGTLISHAGLGWRGVLLVAAGVAVGMSVLQLILLRDSPRAAGIPLVSSVRDTCDLEETPSEVKESGDSQRKGSGSTLSAGDRGACCSCASMESVCSSLKMMLTEPRFYVICGSLPRFCNPLCSSLNVDCRALGTDVFSCVHMCVCGYCRQIAELCVLFGWCNFCRCFLAAFSMMFTYSVFEIEQFSTLWLTQAFALESGLASTVSSAFSGG